MKMMRPKNVYKNAGRETYKTQSNVLPKIQSADWSFKLIPMKESFEIAKTTDYNDVRYTDGDKKYSFWFDGNQSSFRS